MLEKIRVAVDQETESILDRITQGIENRLTLRPEWSNKFAAELLDNVRQFLLEKPEWAATLQEFLLTSENDKANQISRELQEVKLVGIVLGEQSEQSRQAVVALSSEIQKVENRIDQLRLDSCEDSQTTTALIKQISFEIIKTVSMQCDRMEQLISAKPDWAATVEASLLAYDQKIAEEIDNVSQKVKTVGQGLEERLEQSMQVAMAITSGMKILQNGIDQVSHDSHEDSQTITTLINQVSSEIINLVSAQGVCLEQLISAKPSWAVTLEASLLASTKGEAAIIDNVLQEVKAVCSGLGDSLEMSKQAVTAQSSEIKNIKQCIDQVASDSRESSEATNALISAIGSAIATVQDAAHREAKQMQIVMSEQQQMISLMSGTLKQQSTQMDDLQNRMNYIAKPWWKKIFGGNK